MRIFLLVCLCSTFPYYTIAQSDPNQSVVRSTTGVSGGSVEISANNQTYIIQQSIGQSSAIGTFSENNYTLRQGFIQPNVLSRIMDPDVPLNLQVKVYPNPFAEHITLSFMDETSSDISIEVFNLAGQSVFTRDYPPSQLLRVDLNKLPSAGYILKVRANYRQFIAKILKK